MKRSGGKSQSEQLLEDELAYFINMCGEEDRKVFEKPRKKRTVAEYGRLICIAMAMGLRGAMLWLFARCEDNRVDYDEIFAYIDNAPFAEVKKWINEFIGQIENPLFKRVASDIWSEKEKRLSEKNFSMRELL